MFLHPVVPNCSAFVYPLVYLPLGRNICGVSVTLQHTIVIECKEVLQILNAQGNPGIDKYSVGRVDEDSNVAYASAEVLGP